MGYAASLTWPSWFQPGAYVRSGGHVYCIEKLMEHQALLEHLTELVNKGEKNEHYLRIWVDVKDAAGLELVRSAPTL